MLTDRYTQALAYAASLHAAQRRKGTAIPYVSHLLAVSGLVLEHADYVAMPPTEIEDLAIAALLHDGPEDQGGRPTLDIIRVKFGPRVAAVVEACSDSLDADATNKAPWPERKRVYLEHLKAATDRGYLLVSCADKLHNARAILADLRTHGAGLWERFVGTPDASGHTEKSVAQVVGYYCALADAFIAAPGEHHATARELRLVTAQIVVEAGIAPDRNWERG